MTTSIRILPLLFVVLCSTLWSQPRTTRGTVRDAETGDPLPFVNIRVQNTTRGTTTDRRGAFILHLPPGDHRLVFSYLGYRTETRAVSGGDTLDVALASRPIPFPVITVSPNEDAAVAIIRKAIEAKKTRRDSLRDYSLTAHTKLVFEVDKMEGVAVNSISDSSFTSVLETRTDAYWARPDRYKEIIKARKQTSFIASRSNTIISRFFIMDFSADSFDFGKTVTGPISDEGLDAYYYQLRDTTSLGDDAVFRIHVFPRSEDDPLVTGDLYIADKSFALVRVDLRPDEAAMPDFLDSLRFRQQFARFDNFWMPVDVAIDAKISLSFIIQLKLRLEAYSVLQDYRINEGIAEDFFDRVVIKVLPEADERDSLYWAREALIPNTPEELEAYEKGDSVKASMQEKRNEITWSSPLFGQTFQSGDEYFHVPGVLGLYGFNRVQGHFLSGRFTYTNRRSWLRSVSIEPG
ncbi:MAG: carboxypeptidase-like regulatory domain-containing protein, partial [Chlorobi bacterium]|nr:carboxypeptidase-like regulatory domain-containing protein [Chlorobiota bacterium]